MGDGSSEKGDNDAVGGMNRGFSIVIVTHDRYRKLENLLESIEKANPDGLSEIIVVDDSAGKEKLSDFSFPFRIKHIDIEGRIFISAAKNIGWRAATSDLIFFIDDDNRVGETTFSNPLRVLRETREIAAVFPSVFYNSSRDLVWVYATPFAKGRWGHTLIGRNLPRNMELENRLVDTDALPNAFVIRKKALEDVGGFDESLPVHNSTLLVFRLKSKDWRIVADTSSFIYHDVEIPGRFGYWAQHAIHDPERLFYEIRDWLILMRIIHPSIRFYSLRAIFRASRFIIPNTLVYLLSGRNVRMALLRNLATGLMAGLRESRSVEKR